jgi:hypothetical protein
MERVDNRFWQANKQIESTGLLLRSQARGMQINMLFTTACVVEVHLKVHYSTGFLECRNLKSLSNKRCLT